MLVIVLTDGRTSPVSRRIDFDHEQEHENQDLGFRRLR
jgi:hypothetical protein